MRHWQRVLLTNDGALRDAKDHLTALATAEDSLSKAKSLEDLHYQRGLVDGIRKVLFLITSTTDERKK